MIGNKTDLYSKRQVFIYTVNKFLSECFNEGMVLFHVETSETNMDSFRRVFQKFCGPPVTEWEDDFVDSKRLVPPNIPKPTFTVEKRISWNCSLNYGEIQNLIKKDYLEYLRINKNEFTTSNNNFNPAST